MRDKLCWKIPLGLFSLALDKGLPAPGDAEVLPEMGSEQGGSFQKHWFHSQQIFEAQRTVKQQLMWTCLHALCADSQNVLMPPSTGVFCQFLLYWEITVLTLKGWPLAWKEGWCTTIIMDIFSRRVGLSVCFHALELRANVTNRIFCSKIRWLPRSRISLKKIFVIELEKKKIGLSLSLIFFCRGGVC